jgi:ribosomal protein S18 acetylase RimI-like enzyme
VVAFEVSAPNPDALSLRHPAEIDYDRIIEVVDEWWGGRKMRALLPRLWFQHFTGTSWLLEAPEGRLAGFIIAFVSQDDPTFGYVHMVATDPNWRRAGIGRRLYQLVFEDFRARGVRRVEAVTWPGNRTSVAFHNALGFRIDDGPGTQRLYGTPSYPDYDGYGEERVVFTRDI